MDNNDNKKLQSQIDELKKLVAHLTLRVTRLEIDNKKLRSKVVVANTNVGNIRAELHRRRQ